MRGFELSPTSRRTVGPQAGLRSTQLPVLVTLERSGPMSVNRLANELVMDRTSLSRLVRPLTTRGLIEAAPGEDRRTRTLSLTSRGKESVIEAIPMWGRAQREVLNRLGHSRWQELIEHLTATANLRVSQS